MQPLQQLFKAFFKYGYCQFIFKYILFISRAFILLVLISFFALREKARYDIFASFEIPGKLVHTDTAFSNKFYLRFIFSSMPRQAYPTSGPVWYWYLKPFGEICYSATGSYSPQKMPYPGIFKRFNPPKFYRKK